jgi:hypothetical protein
VIRKEVSTVERLEVLEHSHLGCGAGGHPVRRRGDTDSLRRACRIATRRLEACWQSPRGSYKDFIGVRGGNVRDIYKVCDAGTTNCSNEVTVRLGGPPL